MQFLWIDLILVTWAVLAIFLTMGRHQVGVVEEIEEGSLSATILEKAKLIKSSASHLGFKVVGSFRYVPSKAQNLRKSGRENIKSQFSGAKDKYAKKPALDISPLQFSSVATLGACHQEA